VERIGGEKKIALQGFAPLQPFLQPSQRHAVLFHELLVIRMSGYESAYLKNCDHLIGVVVVCVDRRSFRLVDMRLVELGNHSENTWEELSANGQ